MREWGSEELTHFSCAEFRRGATQSIGWER